LHTIFATLGFGDIGAGQTTDKQVRGRVVGLGVVVFLGVVVGHGVVVGQGVVVGALVVVGDKQQNCQVHPPGF
jgi:UDP-3-O-[3-hydroxymyristoyl] glucosamine N-acyltransferase